MKIFRNITFLLTFVLSLAGGQTSAQIVATPTPTPALKASPTPVPLQTLADLQSKIRGRTLGSEVRRGRVGIKVVSLNSGKVVFENDAEKFFMPASNMKNFTVAAALERLGPDFKFVTGVYVNSLPDTSGTVKGDLRIFGRGDISISTAFFGTSASDPETYYRGIDRLADSIAAAGVKRIEGSILGDESYFRGFAIPATWEWDDLQWYYGAEISALPLNDNAVDISVSGGSVGSPCLVTVSPSNSLFQIVNTCTTGSGRRTLGVHKRIDRNILEITGTMPAGDRFSGSVTVTRPADLFVAILKQRLEKRGITITGNARVMPTNTSTPSPQIEIAKLESLPFSVIVAKTMKPSQNMYTETILWTLGEVVGRKSGAGGESGHLGIGVVKNFLRGIGISDDSVVMHDGSGLSRHNLVTPSAVATLYSYMAKQSRNAAVWRNSLTVGGIDGTLTKRFNGTPAAGNFRGKTGTLDQVSALSGYLTTVGGEELVVSIIVNGIPDPSQRTALIDDIVVQLVKFNGKIEP